MSYFLADASGFREDFASIGGLNRFYHWAQTQASPIVDLATEGYTEDVDGLRAALAHAKVTPEVQAQVTVLTQVAADADGLLIISDGMTGEEPRILARRAAKETALHVIADAYAPKLAVALRYAFSRARKTLAPGKDRVDAALTVLETELYDVLPRFLEPLFMQAGQEAALMLQGSLRGAQAEDSGAGEADLRLDSLLLALAGGTSPAQPVLRAAKKTGNSPTPDPQVGFTFDVKQRRAVDWADRHAAELVTQITDTTRENINNAIAELLETGDWSDAVAEILDAVGNEHRAELIARNEVMVAVHEGQREAWDQAVEAGLLTGNEEREWIITGDDKVCPICEELDGVRADLNGVYVTSSGDEYAGPPAHVACRCTEGIAS